eukprot:scaffold11459_cov64-Phaeocystis_antarctica.AAC.6
MCHSPAAALIPLHLRHGCRRTQVQENSAIEAGYGVQKKERKARLHWLESRPSVRIDRDREVGTRYYPVTVLAAAKDDAVGRLVEGQPTFDRLVHVDPYEDLGVAAHPADHALLAEQPLGENRCGRRLAGVLGFLVQLPLRFDFRRRGWARRQRRGWPLFGALHTDLPLRRHQRGLPLFVAPAGAAAASDASDAGATVTAACAHVRHIPYLRASDASDAFDTATTVTAACAVGGTSACRSRLPATGATAWRTSTATHLDLDGRASPDSPACEHRFTLKPLAAVVQLEVVGRHPRAVAEGLVQEGSGQLQ